MNSWKMELPSWESWGEREMRRISNLLRLSLQDGRIEGRELIFSCENSKIITHCWTRLTGECWMPPKKDTPHPRAKENPQQDYRRGEIIFRIKPHTPQRHSEGSNNPCAPQGPDTPQRLSQNCVWVSPAEVWISSGLPEGQGLWVQQTWVWHKPSWRKLPLAPPQRHPNSHRTGETESWRAQTKPCVHQDTGGRSSDPTRDWPRLAHECPGVSGIGMGQWWPATGLGELSAAVSALLKEVAIIFNTSTIF